MLIVFILVLLLGIWGAYNEEIGWWEAAAYCVITAGGAGIALFFSLPPTLSVIPGVICGIILLFRRGIANASGR